MKHLKIYEDFNNDSAIYDTHIQLIDDIISKLSDTDFYRGYSEIVDNPNAGNNGSLRNISQIALNVTQLAKKAINEGPMNNQQGWNRFNELMSALQKISTINRFDEHNEKNFRNWVITLNAWIAYLENVKNI